MSTDVGLKVSIVPEGADRPDSRPAAADAIAINDLNFHVLIYLRTNVGQKYHKTPIEWEATNHVGQERAKTFIEIAVTKLIETAMTHYNQKWTISCSRSY